MSSSPTWTRRWWILSGRAAARGVRRVPGARGHRPPLDYLDSEGALAFKSIPDSPVERLVAAHRTWLVVDRGWPRRPCCGTRTLRAGSSASSRPRMAASSRWT